jgi:hypothetical protein
MIVVRTFLAAILGGLVFIAHPAWAQTRSSAAYSHVLDLYRAGHIAAALATLTKLTDDEVQSGQKVTLKTWERAAHADFERGAAPLRVAAMVHTEAAFALNGINGDGAAGHFLTARTYVEKVASAARTDPFSRDWWLLVIAFFQGQLELSQAASFADRARALVGDSPQLFLAIGITEEMGWTFGHDTDRKYAFGGDLGDAESAYRSALAGQPDLVEARVRLGRVLTLRGRVDESLRVLSTIGAAEDPESRYLARLFEGDALERRGNVSEAERRYLAAFAAVPSAQSARVALAHVRYLNGARADAAAAVRATAADGTGAETADPWFWYTRGLLWRTAGYLLTLRALAQR